MGRPFLICLFIFLFFFPALTAAVIVFSARAFTAAFAFLFFLLTLAPAIIVFGARAFPAAIAGLFLFD